MKISKLLAASGSLVPAWAGVPCYMIGTQYYKLDRNSAFDANAANGGMPVGPQLDPFKSGQGFDIIDVRSTWVRFHNPTRTMAEVPGTENDFAKAMLAARVTQAKWGSTPDSVYDAIEKDGTGSDMLWLPGDLNGWTYIGLLKPGVNMNPLSGLQTKDTIVNFILPSASGKNPDGSPGSVTTKVTPVLPSNGDMAGVQRAKNAGIIGLTGSLDPQQDYAYAPMFAAAYGFTRLYKPPTVNQLQGLDPNPNGNQYEDAAFIWAAKANGDCVVIDLRQLGSYTLNVDSYADTEMCSPAVQNGQDAGSFQAPAGSSGHNEEQLAGVTNSTGQAAGSSNNEANLAGVSSTGNKRKRASRLFRFGRYVEGRSVRL